MKSKKIICMFLICCSFCGCAEGKEEIDEYVSVELNTEELSEKELENRKFAFTLKSLKKAIEEFSYDEMKQVSVSHTDSEGTVIINIQILVEDGTDLDIKEEIRSTIEDYAKKWFSEDILITVEIV